jgi:hypothetical protein
MDISRLTCCARVCLPLPWVCCSKSTHGLDSHLVLADLDLDSLQDALVRIWSMPCMLVRGFSCRWVTRRSPRGGARVSGRASALLGGAGRSLASHRLPLDGGPTYLPVGWAPASSAGLVSGISRSVSQLTPPRPGARCRGYHCSADDVSWNRPAVSTPCHQRPQVSYITSNRSLSHTLQQPVRMPHPSRARTRDFRDFGRHALIKRVWSAWKLGALRSLAVRTELARTPPLSEGSSAEGWAADVSRVVYRRFLSCSHRRGVSRCRSSYPQMARCPRACCR